jgi:hypothetical protein
MTVAIYMYLIPIYGMVLRRRDNLLPRFPKKCMLALEILDQFILNLL